MIKQYLVFAGYTYYPFGGWHDFQRAWNELAIAKDHVAMLLTEGYNWAQIVDVHTNQVVWQDRRSHDGEIS